jgi:hypothetical protein
MTRRARTLLPLFALAATTSLAAAKPAQGFAPRPRPIEIIGDESIRAYVEDHGAALLQCAELGSSSFARLQVRLSWNRRGKISSVGVSGGGARVNRCAGKALRGSIALAAPRAGRGKTQVLLRTDGRIRTPAPTPVATPVPTLQRCTADADCVIHFQESACIPGDPVAVSATASAAAVRAAFPVRRIECGMGGPQYDELRRSNEGRYTPACEAKRCVVRDAGPQPTGPGGLRPAF